MKKLKFDFKTAKKWIATGIAATILTTFATGCSRIDDKKIDANTYENEEIETVVDVEETEIPYIEETEITQEKNVGKYAEKIVISSVEDIEEAKKYDSIRYLKIEKANIKDFSFLKDINIELLQVLYNNEPLDMECINSESIKQLYLHEVELVNTDACENFKNLENFVIKSNSINRTTTNFDFLKQCKNITNIEIENYAIKDLDFVENMNELSTLSVISSSVEDISCLKNCDNLLSLTLKRGRIKDISSIADMKELQYLDLSENYISDVRSINNTNLSYLNLQENSIKDVSGLKSLKNLTAINLSQNYIKEFPAHLIKDNLSLDLSYNNIKNLTAEDKRLLNSTNVFVNMFDNLLSNDTVKEIGTYQSIYFEANGGILDSNQALEYNREMSKILSTMKSGEDKGNVMKINKYIVDNCKLDFSYVAENKDNAYGAMFDKSVCTGMTDLTNSMLRHLDIEVKEYHGDMNDITDNERHVWTACKIGNEWFHCDPMQSKVHLDENDYPEIVMLSDSQIREYGHILDAPNVQKCNSELSAEERNNIIENIEKDNSQELEDDR